MLTERRKADRTRMAQALATIAADLGASVQIGAEFDGPRKITVSIAAARGLCINIDFDGKSCQPDVFVCPWHMSSKTDACLSDAFPGSVNPFHWSKAMTVCYGFENLCAHVAEALEMARDGSCFDPDREVRSIAKNGTWQEREARFAQWRTEVTGENQNV